MNTPSNIQKLASAGTSVWLDDLSRSRLTSGELASLIDAKGIVGVTTNPAIFAAAMSQGDAYDEQLRELAAAGVDADEAVFAMAVKDVQDACDVLAGVHEQTDGVDGWVPSRLTLASPTTLSGRSPRPRSWPLRLTART